MTEATRARFVGGCEGVGVRHGGTEKARLRLDEGWPTLGSCGSGYKSLRVAGGVEVGWEGDAGGYGE